MVNFEYYLPTKVIFGKGTHNKVGAEIKKLGKKKVLLHYGGQSLKKTGVYDEIVASLTEAGISFVELGGVQPNPKLSLIREGIALCRKENVDLILAAGGGSVIDSAKGIAAGTPYDGDVWDLYMGQAVPQRSVAIGTILTIAAAGSEMSPFSVVSNEEGGLKRSLRTDHNRPAFSILNPELTFTLPKYQIACGISDIIVHTLERYFSSNRDNEFTDRLCEGLLRAVMEVGARSVKNPLDYEARANLMWAGTVSHNDTVGVGRVQDWATHQIEHELSGMYDFVAHGAGLASVWASWARYVYKTDVNHFAQFANRVFDVEVDPSNPEKAALEGIKKMEEFFHSIGMPTNLKELGVPSDKFEEMAEKCMFFGKRKIGGFKILGKEDVIKIYEMAKGE